MHAAKLALVLSGLSDAYRTGTAMLLVASLFLGACVLEMGYIGSMPRRPGGGLCSALGGPIVFVQSVALPDK